MANLKDLVVNGSARIIGDIYGNLIGTATKATQDSAGQNIADTYIKSLSVSGRTITYTKGDGGTGTITTQDTNTTYGNASTSTAGLMSATDKGKLDGIATGANKYVLPVAGSAIGGVKSGTGITVDSSGNVSVNNDSHTHSNSTITSLDASKLTGTIPTSLLPSYVDDVLEYTEKANFPTTGEAGKIYVDKATNKTYRWGGSAYVEISASLALGTTSSTAFRGDYGNTAYSHATAKGAAFASGLYKITTNAQGHVTAATAVSKADITALGIPGSDTNTTYSAGAGISLSGTTFSNSGVRSISSGSTNGTISVNTNGTATEVAVKGLGSAAYTNSNYYISELTTDGDMAKIWLGYVLHYNSAVKTDTPSSIVGGNQGTILQALPGGDKYNAQFCIGFGTTYPAIRILNSSTSTWGPWQKISAGYADNAARATADSNGANIASTYLKRSAGRDNPLTGTLYFLTNNWTGNLIALNASGKKRWEFYSNSSSGAVSSSIFRVYTDDTGSAYKSYTFGADGAFRANTVYGAVWNDYAEFRKTTSAAKPGQIVIENGDGSLRLSAARLESGANVVSDTFGFAIGETDDCKTPIAVSGRALVYTYEDRNTFVAGEPVCSGPNGTVSRMTEQEARDYPWCIVGTVSEVPSYERWGTGNVEVDNRIWIKVN